VPFSSPTLGFTAALCAMVTLALDLLGG